METYHTILYSHPMKKGFLVIEEIGVREPKLVCHTIIQGQVKFHLCIGKALISPTLLEIHCDGVILTGREGAHLE